MSFICLCCVCLYSYLIFLARYIAFSICDSGIKLSFYMYLFQLKKKSESFNGYISQQEEATRKIKEQSEPVNTSHRTAFAFSLAMEPRKQLLLPTLQRIFIYPLLRFTNYYLFHFLSPFLYVCINVLYMEYKNAHICIYVHVHTHSFAKLYESVLDT